jgi:hypothetical protein
MHACVIFPPPLFDVQKTEHEFKKGDVIMVLLQNCAKFVFSFLGASMQTGQVDGPVLSPVQSRFFLCCRTFSFLTTRLSGSNPFLSLALSQNIIIVQGEVDPNQATNSKHKPRRQTSQIDLFVHDSSWCWCQSQATSPGGPCM